MKINRLHIDGFGLFHDKSIEGFKKGVNVLYGKNEKGKSTLLDFIRFTLFGYPNYKADRRPPLMGGNHGGKLFLEHSQGKALELYRDGNKKIDFSVNGILSDELLYHQLMAGATKDMYENVYAITLDELVDMSAINDSGMKDRIFSLGMGMAKVDFGAFEDNLKRQAENLFIPRGSTQEIVELQTKIESNQQKIRVLQDNVKAYNEKSAAYKSEKEKQKEFAAKEKNVRDRLFQLQGYSQSTEAFLNYQRSHSELMAFGDFKVHPYQLFEDYRLKKQGLESSREQKEGIEREINRLESEKKSIKLEKELADNLAVLDDLKAEIKLYAANIQDIEEDQILVKKAEREIKEELEELEGNYTLEAILRLKGVKQLVQKAKEFKQKEEVLLQNTHRIADQLKMQEENRQYEVEVLQEKEKALKQRKINDEATCQAAKERLIVLETAQTEALSGNSIAVSGVLQKVLFWVIAAVLLTSAIVLWAVAPIVTVLIIVALLLLLLSKFIGKQRGKTINSSVSLLEINREIGELNGQLRSYEEALKELEEKLELNNRKDYLINQLNDKIIIDKEGLLAIQKAWNELLNVQQLKENISIAYGEYFFQSVIGIQNKHHQLEGLKTEIEKGSLQLNEFKKKVKTVDSGSSTTVEAVRLLIEKMEKEQDKMKQIERFQDQILLKDKDLVSVNQKIKQTEADLSEKIKSIDLKNELSFYRQFEHQKQYEQLKNDLKDAEYQIKTNCGAGERFEKAIQFLGNTNKEALKQQLDEAEIALTDVLEQNETSNKRLGELRAESKALLEEKELFALQNQREVLLNQYEDAVKQWMVYRMAMEVLNENKLKYEKEKQPEVINASRKYFQAITDNAYSDVRISLSEKKVTIIDAAGRKKQVNELSRGTREQLLLALRLGLIEEYEKNAEPLPLALDDVMVNFDKARAERLAEVLTDFAKDRQVLLFSCHERTLELFQNKNATVLNW